jgi:cell wall-associated NlpC family hydrolase
MKILNKHYYLTIFIGLLIVMGCVAQPRYTPYPAEAKSHPPAEEKGEIKKETPSSEKESKTNVNQIKMSPIISSFLGTPYKEGGTSKLGMDCSGFVVEVYKKYAGFNLPHNTEKLFKLVKKVDKENLGYGDLVFFSDFGFLPSHVGIYIGEGKFVHSTEGYGVIVSSLEDERYRKSYIGARRVIP